MDFSRVRFSGRRSCSQFSGHQMEHWRQGFHHDTTCKDMSLNCLWVLLTMFKSRTLRDADSIRIMPAKHRGQGEIVPIVKQNVSLPLLLFIGLYRPSLLNHFKSLLTLVLTRSVINGTRISVIPQRHSRRFCGCLIQLLPVLS
jgi:hypothetical protein